MVTYQLDLDHFMFPEITARANKNHFENAKNRARRKPIFDLAFEYKFDPSGRTITVNLFIESKDVGDLDPYEFKIEIFGIFCIKSNESPERELGEAFSNTSLKPLVVNAVQVLAGCARDAIHSATSKGPYGPLVLPLIFINQKDIPDPEKAKEQ